METIAAVYLFKILFTFHSLIHFDGASNQCNRQFLIVNSRITHRCAEMEKLTRVNFLRECG